MSPTYEHTITTGYPVVIPQPGQTVRSMLNPNLGVLTVVRVEPMLACTNAAGQEVQVYAHEVELVPATGEERANVVPKLAGAFYAVLRDWLSADELAEVRRRNATPEYARACASHDFCDANEAMDAAFKQVLGRSANSTLDADTALWNEAWELARARFLSIATLHTCEYTADALDPTPDHPACGKPASVFNPRGKSGQRLFDYDEWYCAEHADPAWLGIES